MTTVTHSAFGQTHGVSTTKGDCDAVTVTCQPGSSVVNNVPCWGHVDSRGGWRGEHVERSLHLPLDLPGT